jgi:hypothetical protein
MDIDLAALPGDVKTLQRMVRLLAAERTSLSEAQSEIERLYLIIKKLQRSQFGRRAERLDDDQLQLGLEDLNADLARAEAILPSAKTITPRTQDERPSLPAHLPREDRRFDVEHQACSCCAARCMIGETVSEMLDHVPARLRVIRICRPRYGCRACGTIQAPAPERPIAKGLATAPCSLMSWSPNTAIICPSTGKAKSLPGRASRSTARPLPTGSAAPAGCWSRCRKGLLSTSSLRRSCS